ncbi:conjugal transfer protein TraF [Vibrio rotiferianus]
MKRMLRNIIAPLLCLISMHSNAVHLNDFKDDYGVFFFEQSTCNYCIKMIPKLNNIDAAYDIDILPVSLDGIPVPNSGKWASKTIPDKGRLTAVMPVDVTPTFYVINKKTRQAAKMGYGDISEAQFMENLVLALRAIQVVPQNEPLSLEPMRGKTITDSLSSDQSSVPNFSPAPAQSSATSQTMADEFRASLKKKYLSGQ